MPDKVIPEYRGTPVETSVLFPFRTAHQLYTEQIEGVGTLDFSTPEQHVVFQKTTHPQ